MFISVALLAGPLHAVLWAAFAQACFDSDMGDPDDDTCMAGLGRKRSLVETFMLVFTSLFPTSAVVGTGCKVEAVGGSAL